MSSQTGSHAADIEQAANPATDAPAPFNKPTADLILRSSDGVRFRVRKAILAEASPIFEDMFTLPAPRNSDNLAIGPPVVDMTEDSRTVHGLLRLCYPISETPIRTLDEASILLDAVRKYSMDGALNYLGQRLIVFADAEPLRVYALAIRYELQEEILKASAKGFLTYI
ncbi:uncharacterized protein C8Q71DRAFT_121602 [Rhodofomes roseus]|nr:uncharacterized protein C8Q71DRAFT_121602 [Rhodofomes roseus]KAH9834736.1 hypothetical protein C8Q71DRAFT_121602 [Rhodofomes roseus]